MIIALKAKIHSMWKRLFSSVCCSWTTGWQCYLFSRSGSHSPSESICLACSRSGSPQGLSWETWTTLAAGSLAVSFRCGNLDKSISCCCKLLVVLLSQPCGKERTASDQCQTNLLQLTCAVNVEPNDPDLDGNHCKYFPAKSVEETFNKASQQGI